MGNKLTGSWDCPPVPLCPTPSLCPVFSIVASNCTLPHHTHYHQNVPKDVITSAIVKIVPIGIVGIWLRICQDQRLRTFFDFFKMMSLTLRRNKNAIAELDIIIMSFSKEGVSWTLLLVLDRRRSPGFAAAAGEKKVAAPPEILISTDCPHSFCTFNFQPNLIEVQNALRTLYASQHHCAVGAHYHLPSQLLNSNQHNSCNLQ